MLTLLEIYKILKEIAEVVSLAKDFQIQALDSRGIYLRALDNILMQEQKVFLTKGINFNYNLDVFEKKIKQNSVDFNQLPVSPEILDEQIGSQVAQWLLDSTFLIGVDIGIEVNSGWAEKVAQAANRKYSTLLFESLFNDAVRKELQFIANKVKDNEKIQDYAKQLLSLSKDIVFKLTPDYTSLNSKTVQELFGISAYFVEFDKIGSATQERLKSFYQGDLLWWDGNPPLK